jgi:hypothetical protein
MNLFQLIYPFHFAQQFHLELLNSGTNSLTIAILSLKVNAEESTMKIKFVTLALVTATVNLFGDQSSPYRCRFVHAISFRTAIPFGIAEFWHKFLNNNNFVIDNLSFGFISSKSREISHFSSKGIAEGVISEKKNGKDRGKILDFERIEPKTQVDSESQRK